MALIQIVRRIWESPTANTWWSLSTRALSLILVIPLVLRRFEERETALWFVFSSVVAVQSLLSFGFVPTFARLFSYARAGGTVESMQDLRGGIGADVRAETNWHSIHRLYSSQHQIFLCAAMLGLIIMLTFGSLVVWKPLASAGHRADFWVAWLVICATSSATLFGNGYMAFLQGMNQIALYRRWETLFAMGSIFSGFSVLLLGGGLLALVVANQSWVLVGVFANRSLCCRVGGRRVRAFRLLPWDALVFGVVWQSAWKSGITSLLNLGLIQATGIIQAQSGESAATATYILTLRVMTMLGQLSLAPFVSKLPELARLWAAAERSSLLILLKRGMRQAHWTLVIPLVLVPLVAPLALRVIKSRSVEFDFLLWSIFAINLFCERWSGMLQQVRNLTNRPVEHQVVVGYCSINLLLIMLLIGRLGMYAFPLGMLGAQLFWAVWLGAKAAYATLKVRPFEFEKTVALPPFAVLGLILLTLLLSVHE